MSDMKTIYYPVWISPGRKAGGWSWGKPCDSVGEADRLLGEQLRASESPLGCVVEVSGGEKTPLLGHVRPPSARRIVEHWEDLWEVTE